MFEAARAAKVERDRLQAVWSEVERAIQAGTFRLTDVLNADPDLQQVALGYLHGRQETSRKEPVLVQIEVLQPIVKNHTLTVHVQGRERAVGGSATMATTGDGRVLRRVTEPGVHTMTTDQAVWYLYNYGVGVQKNDIRPEATRRPWCREVPRSAPAAASAPRAARAATG